MKYKILLLSKSGNTDYYKYYQVSSAEGDWSTTDKAEAVAKITELLNQYSLSELSVVISLDITTTIDIPEIPTTTTDTEVTQ